MIRRVCKDPRSFRPFAILIDRQKYRNCSFMNSEEQLWIGNCQTSQRQRLDRKTFCRENVWVQYGPVFVGSMLGWARSTLELCALLVQVRNITGLSLSCPLAFWLCPGIQPRIVIAFHDTELIRFSTTMQPRSRFLDLSNLI
jgi:hypothetical protein